MPTRVGTGNVGAALPGSALTPGELRTMRAYARLGLIKNVADELGLSQQTVKNHLWRSYQKLGASNGIEAMNALGWVVIR